MEKEVRKEVAVIVAHPDDEILWSGGTLLLHQEWNCVIISLCRGSDPDRAPRFFQVATILNSLGYIGDLDDAPAQIPLSIEVVEETILKLLPQRSYDIVLTHSPEGEYTRHLRHEETARAVISLWNKQLIIANEVRLFAYEDGNRQYFPRPITDATLHFKLPLPLWERKYQLMTQTYGFNENSWEAKTTPKEEAFHQLTATMDSLRWLKNEPKP